MVGARPVLAQRACLVALAALAALDVVNALPSASAGAHPPLVVRNDADLLKGLRAGASDIVLPCSASVRLGSAWAQLVHHIDRKLAWGGTAWRLVDCHGETRPRATPLFTIPHHHTPSPHTTGHHHHLLVLLAPSVRHNVTIRSEDTGATDRCYPMLDFRYASNNLRWKWARAWALPTPIVPKSLAPSRRPVGSTGTRSRLSTLSRSPGGRHTSPLPRQSISPSIFFVYVCVCLCVH
jgi:hypothetical protein